MAFDRQHFSVNVDSIGGGGLRLHHYRSDDTFIQIYTEGYITEATQLGVREHEFVVIQAEDSVAIAEVFSIDANGNATLRLMLDDFVRPENFGGVGDGVTDDTAALQAALVAMSAREAPLWLTAGKSYLTTSALSTDEDFVWILGGGKIVTTELNIAVLSIGSGRDVITTTVTGNVTVGAKIVSVASTTGINVGDVVRFVSTKAWYNDPRAVAGISSSDAAGTAQAGGASTITLEAINTLTSAQVVGQWLTIVRGTGVGQARQATAFDVGTEVMTVSQSWETVPDNTSAYVFPEATKGETHVVGRVVSGTTLEIQGVMADGYHVVNTVTEGKAKEAVNVEVYPGYSVTLDDVGIEGPLTGSGSTSLVTVSNAVNNKIDIRVRGGRFFGLKLASCYNSKVKVSIDTMTDFGLGYGVQLYNCSRTDIDASGWHARRIADVSGTTPSDMTRVHSFFVSGGGLQEDGSAYYPIGDVDNYGVGSHGTARKTVYENGYIDSVRYGIYERGRDSIIRNVRFGPDIQYPVVYAFGGTHEIYACVADAGAFENVSAVNDQQEAADFSGVARDAYSDCFVNLGMVNQRDSQISIHDNTVKVKNHLLEIQVFGSEDYLSNAKIYDNDVEFFPLEATDETALFGKTVDSDANVQGIQGVICGPNRMRTAATNVQPVIWGAEMSLLDNGEDPRELGPGLWTWVHGDDLIVTLPCSLNYRDCVRLSIVDDVAPTTTYFDGWLVRNSATLVGDALLNVEGLATAPVVATDGTDTFLGLHFDDGLITILNRRGDTLKPILHIHGIA